VIKSVETNPIDLNMFKIDNVDVYTCLKVPIFVLEAIQKTTIVGRVIGTLINSIVVSVTRMINSNVDSSDECVGLVA
jgi:hypothetical protein